LWIPVEGDRSIPVGERRIGSPVLWRPNANEAHALQQDWEEIMELIAMGKVDKVTARHGEVLQLRPKAANSKALTESIAEDGTVKLSNPRGFYLKINFTHQILTNAFN
jgi:DNA mismatch repair protein MutH